MHMSEFFGNLAFLQEQWSDNCLATTMDEQEGISCGSRAGESFNTKISLTIFIPSMLNESLYFKKLYQVSADNFVLKCKLGRFIGYLPSRAWRSNSNLLRGQD